MSYVLHLLYCGAQRKTLTSAEPFHRFNPGDEIKQGVIEVENKSPLFVKNVSHDFITTEDGRTVISQIMTLDLEPGSESLRQGFRAEL